MGRASQGHTREVQGVDSADHVGVTGLPGTITGGGYGGGGIEPGTPPFYPPVSTMYGGGVGPVQPRGVVAPPPAPEPDPSVDTDD